MKFIIAFYDWLRVTPEGRSLYRGLKTFGYCFVGIIATAMASGIAINWTMALGAAIVAAIGFSSDKGLREFKGLKNNK